MLHVLCSTLFLRTKKHPHGQTPHGCLLLSWWSIGGRAHISLFRAPLYRKVGKKLAANIKFHCAPAIGLDFYQVYFFICRWQGIRTDRCKEKDKRRPCCQPPVGYNGHTPCPHALYFTRFSILLQPPRVLN
mgnify:CR=1 FL=1